MVYHIQTLANATWDNLNNIWSLNLNSFFKSTSINLLQIEPRSHQYHAMIHFLNVHYNVMFTLLLSRCLLLLDRSIAGRSPCFLRRVAPPSLNNKASKPPLIISIKTQFPLLFSYA